MTQIVITLDSSEILSLEKQGNKEALIKVHDLAFIFASNFLSLFSFFDTMIV